VYYALIWWDGSYVSLGWFRTPGGAARVWMAHCAAHNTSYAFETCVSAIRTPEIALLTAGFMFDRY